MQLEIRLYRTNSPKKNKALVGFLEGFDSSLRDRHVEEDGVSLKSHEGYRHVDKGYGLLINVDEDVVDTFVKKLGAFLSSNDIDAEGVYDFETSEMIVSFLKNNSLGNKCGPRSGFIGKILDWVVG